MYILLQKEHGETLWHRKWVIEDIAITQWRKVESILKPVKNIPLDLSIDHDDTITHIALWKDLLWKNSNYVSLITTKKNLLLALVKVWNWFENLTFEEKKKFFNTTWEKSWANHNIWGKVAFQVMPLYSPYEIYSSRWWKIHISIKKWFEKILSETFFHKWWYFKTNGNLWTYFNGIKEAWITIYVGSYKDMISIAWEIYKTHFDKLTTGFEDINQKTGETITIWSWTDIHVFPWISARFDIAKTRQYIENKKYTDYAIHSHTGYSWIPILVTDNKKYDQYYHARCNTTNKANRNFYSNEIKKIYDDALQELQKDFWTDFVWI